MKLIRWLGKYLRRPWFPLLVAFLAAADSFLLTLPIDGLLASSVAANKARWWRIATMVSVGSAIGGGLLAALFLWQRTWLLTHLPALSYIESNLSELPYSAQQFGDIALFLGVVGPIPMHPFILVSVFSGASPLKIIAIIFFGRLLKYLFISWVTCFAPGFLRSSMKKGIGLYQQLFLAKPNAKLNES